MDNIFVQIASYRDRECQSTITDLFEKAAHPNRISVGLCWQFDPHKDAGCLQLEIRPKQVRRIDVPANETCGVCWARREVQRLWHGEQYTLMTDSHMRFVPEWDVKAIEELSACKASKPVLSSNPAAYRPPNQLSPDPRPTVRGIKQFRPDGTIRGIGRSLKRNPPHPLHGAFIVCCFVFSRAEIIEEVPHDPFLYFNQEEIVYSARAWTHGWDIFSPSSVLAYHYYNNDGNARPLHWKDSPQWKSLDRTATRRYLHLMGMKSSDDPQVVREIEMYGLGHQRTLRQYEEYCGVNFSRREVTERAMKCKFVEDF
jgi:Glycosyltransferase (GlcNAc)